MSVCLVVLGEALWMSCVSREVDELCVLWGIIDCVMSVLDCGG